MRHNRAHKRRCLRQRRTEVGDQVVLQPLRGPRIVRHHHDRLTELVDRLAILAVGAHAAQHQADVGKQQPGLDEQSGNLVQRRRGAVGVRGATGGDQDVEDQGVDRLADHCLEGKILAVGVEAITVSLDGHPDKLDDFEELLDGYGIVELQRTGRVALPKLDREARLRAVNTKNTNGKAG